MTVHYGLFTNSDSLMGSVTASVSTQVAQIGTVQIEIKSDLPSPLVKDLVAMREAVLRLAIKALEQEIAALKPYQADSLE